MRQRKHECLPLTLFKQCLHVGHCCANDVGIDLISKCFIPLKWHQSAQSWLMSLRVLDAPKTESHTHTHCGKTPTQFVPVVAVAEKVDTAALYWASGFERPACGWPRGHISRR